MARMDGSRFALAVALAVVSLAGCGGGGSSSNSGDGGGGGDGGPGGSSCPTMWSTLVPFAPIMGDATIRDMHVDGDTLYYSALGQILSVPLAGGSPTTLVSQSLSQFWSFAVLPSGIDYVKGDGSLVSIMKSGASPMTLGMLANFSPEASDRAGDFWTDGKTAVWLRATNDPSGNTLMGIRAMDIASQATTDLVQNATDTLGTVRVVGGTVYYNEGPSPGAPGASKVQSVPLTGGSPTTLQPNVMFAVDTGGLYFGSANGLGSASDTMRAPLAGGAGSMFAAGGPTGFDAQIGNAVFVDTRAFFAGLQGDDGWTILQAPRGGGSPQVVFCLGNDPADTYTLDAFDVSGHTLYVALTRNSDMAVGIVDAPLP